MRKIKDQAGAFALIYKQDMFAKSAEQPVFQYRLAKAAAAIDVARACLRSVGRSIWEGAAAAPRGIALITHPLAVANSAQAIAAVEMCVGAVDTLHDIAGGNSVRDEFTLSRRWRDIHALTQHVALGDPQLTRYGAALLDAPANS